MGQLKNYQMFEDHNEQHDLEENKTPLQNRKTTNPLGWSKHMNEGQIQLHSDMGTSLLPWGYLHLNIYNFDLHATEHDEITWSIITWNTSLEIDNILNYNMSLIMNSACSQGLITSWRGVLDYRIQKTVWKSLNKYNNYDNCVAPQGTLTLLTWSLPYLLQGLDPKLGST